MPASPVWQASPCHPAGQWQRPGWTQLPPCWHGGWHTAVGVGRPVSDPGGCPGPRRRGGVQPGGGCHAGPALALLGSASLTPGTLGAHLPHRPPAARRSASSRGSRHSEAGRGPAWGGGGRRSCRGSCGVGGGGSEGPVALTGRRRGDRGSMLTPGPPTPGAWLPHPVTPSACLPGWLRPRAVRELHEPSPPAWTRSADVSPEGLSPGEGTSGSPPEPPPCPQLLCGAGRPGLAETQRNLGSSR